MCWVCLVREGSGMCGPCGKSYDRRARRIGDVLEAMRWAAERARRFERKRQRAIVAETRAAMRGARA